MGTDHSTLMLIGIAALAIELLGMIAAAIWAVSKIRSTTEMLRSEIHMLGEDIKDLKRVIKTIEDRQWEHAKDLAKLQAHHEANSGE